MEEEEEEEEVGDVNFVPRASRKFSPMSETGMIALASNEKDDHPVQEHGEGCDGEEKLISMQE
eukprot:495095-Hanusia_phi.AAC.4